ncbi:MAG: dockerin type I domain-containing protein [Bryobacteraceae bacterium]
MSRSVAFRGFRSIVPAIALVVGLAAHAPLAHATPPPAPQLTIDTTYPNLFYGAIPTKGYDLPVVVFVHGLGGSYVDWIESANCPTNPAPIGNCKSSPTSPGTGSKNDMYDYAYQAGFRTAFMSMNADNSTNSSSIQTNAAMLQTLFPAILAHFGVTKVYFVCHSKGGLDLEDAIANPQWIGMAIAIIQLGTPNQGDALADWCFSSAGTAVCSLAGLLTPGVQSLEIANVLQLRTEWDPLFQNSLIPFYTLSGNTYECQKGTTECPTIITGPILQQITTPPGGNPTGTCDGPTNNAPTNAPCNDGLVTHPESLLPTAYAMELGIIPVNHYLLRMGDYSFTYINGVVQELSHQQPGMTRVGTGGFGDQHNSWSWSMAWFTPPGSANGMLYVGVGREPGCVTGATTAIQLGISSEYPPTIGDCPPDYHDLPLQAEIWQYNPATNIWTLVFQSPNSLSTVEFSGNAVSTARDIGFRGLTIVNEPGGVVALYAGGVTSGEIFECFPTTGITTGCTQQGSWPPPRILRTTDGVTWNPIPQNGTLTTVAGSSVWTPGTCGTQPCFLGSLTANGTYITPAYPNYSIRSAAQLCSQPGPSFSCTADGVLFFQTGDFPGVGRAFASAPGTNPALGDNCGQPTCFSWSSPVTATLPMWILENFNNSMYAGTGSPAITDTAEQYGVWSTNGTGTPPYTWNPIIVDGAYATNLIADFAMSMEIYSDPTYCPPVSPGGPGGCLYVGTDRPNEMVRIHPDMTGQVVVDATDSWDLIVGNPRTIPAGTGPGQLGTTQYVAPLSGIGQYFDNGFTGHFWRMGVGSQGIYMGTWDQSTDDYVQNPGLGALWSQEYGTDLWRSPDGVNWTFMSKVGMGDGNNTGTRSSAASPFGLFMGTAREQGGTQVFNVDNGNLDFNKDGVIDQKDVNLMRARLNAKAKFKDPMDLNEDGKITEADVQLLMTQCTHPNCAVPAIKPATSTLTPPLVHSAPGAQGGPATLTWNAVSGAMDYLVYQIGMSCAVTTPPPSAAVVACGKPHPPSICAMLPQAIPATTCGQLYGYPGPPDLLGRVPNLTYTGPSPSTLQSLYFVVAEDSLGNLSSPSNTVGGPSLATQ